MTNRLSRWLLVAIVLVAASFWWLLIDADRGTAPAKPIHIAELRALATALPGNRPTAIGYTVLATRKITGDFYAAGIGLKRRRLTIVAWTLPVPHKSPIVIGPRVPVAATTGGRFASFANARQSRIDAQAEPASLVLTTQGRQAEPPRGAHRTGRAGGARFAPRPAPPLAHAWARAVAPGVVVVPAFSHAADARLIYVELAGGGEFLFVGDIAPFTENWTRLRARSHLAAIWGPAQDRAETYAWLRTIRQLHSEAPSMTIVPGGDDAWLTAQRNARAITQFTPAPMPSSRKPR